MGTSGDQSGNGGQGGSGGAGTEDSFSNYSIIKGNGGFGRLNTSYQEIFQITKILRDQTQLPEIVTEHVNEEMGDDYKS